MRRLLLLASAGMLLAPAADRAGEVDEPPIPQDPARQEQAHRDRLAFQRRTLAGAYDEVGKRDPRWDRPARKALEAAARYFGREADPGTTIEEVYAPAREAVAAGCDDPLILYLHARLAFGPDRPGAEEIGRRIFAAAAALEPSAYPPSRRAMGLCLAGQVKALLKEPTPEDRREAARLLDVALDIVAKNAAREQDATAGEVLWPGILDEILAGHKSLTGDSQAAYEHVDAALARAPALQVMRLQFQGQHLIDYAWEARGNGFADTVPEEGWRKFGERLRTADELLRQAWKLRPSGTKTPELMLVVVKGLDADRAEMETWFRRAMEADGDNRNACVLKLDYLNPKWHGSLGELEAFGRACRATKNWRAGLTLLAPEARLQIAMRLPPGEAKPYLAAEDAWGEARSIYDEYLGHYPYDAAQRTAYAAFAFLSGHITEADRQFETLGDGLVAQGPFTLESLKRIRDIAAKLAKRPPPTVQ